MLSEKEFKESLGVNAPGEDPGAQLANLDAKIDKSI